MPNGRPSSPGKSPGKRRSAAPVEDQNNLAEAVHQLQMGLSEKDIEIERLKITVVSLNTKCSVVDDHLEDLKNTTERFEHSEQQREGLQDHIVEAAKKINTDNISHTDYQTELTNEIEALKKKLDQQRREQHEMELQKDREMEQVRQQLMKEMEQLRQQKDLEIKNLKGEKEAQRFEFTTTITELELLVKKQTSDILSLQSQNLSLCEQLEKKADVEDQLEQARLQIAQIMEQKETLQKELENATDYILELEEKVYKANKTSLELLKQLKDAEVEIETLKQYIIDLKQRIAVYIPVKEDAIDKKLAEFINNYPERSKLKIMFMRESEGVYQFGTKRVAVKVEKDNIKIRVGGGYLSLDEFLDQYTPVELEKLERKDPIKRYSEKVAVQKTIVGAGVRESSPVARSPGRQSPGRKAAV